LCRSRDIGRRYCLVAAGSAEFGFLKEATWILEPSGRTGTKDCNEVLSFSSYHRWWNTQLLPSLSSLPRKCLIILDNARYHKTLPSDVPRPSKMNSAEMRAYLEANGIPFFPGEYAMTLRRKVREHISKTVKPAIVSSAEAFGHRVLFIPPLHSELQPLEHIWMRVKSYFSAQNSNNNAISFVDSQKILEESLVLCDQPYWQSVRELISKVEQTFRDNDQLIYGEYDLVTEGNDGEEENEEELNEEDEKDENDNDFEENDDNYNTNINSNSNNNNNIEDDNDDDDDVVVDDDKQKEMNGKKRRRKISPIEYDHNEQELLGKKEDKESGFIGLDNSGGVFQEHKEDQSIAKKRSRPRKNAKILQETQS